MSEFRFGRRPRLAGMMVAATGLMAAAAYGQAPYDPENPEVVDDELFGAFDVWPADIDGDGWRDIVSCSTTANDVVWYRNPGLGGGPWQKFEIELEFGDAISVSAADIDGDGNMDILAAANGEGDIAWWQNGGDPLAPVNERNWTERRIEGGYARVTSIFVVDLDGDTFLDVVACSEMGGTNSVRFWQHPGANVANVTSWREFEIETAFQGAHEIWAHDLNEDGRPDVLGAALIDGDISFWLNPGGNLIYRERSWEEVVVNTVFNGATSVVPADVDGDGLIDLVGSAADDGDIAWFRNPGWETASDGDWQEIILLNTFGGAKNVDVADIDLDGDLDIAAVAQFNGDVVWLQNPGGADARDPADWGGQVLDDVFLTAVGVSLGDLDGDGDSELIAASAELNKVVVWRNSLRTPQVGEPTVPVIRSIVKVGENGGQVTYEITFASDAGTTYEVSGSASLTNFTSEGTVTGEDGTTTVQVTSDGPVRFWKIGIQE